MDAFLRTVVTGGMGKWIAMLRVTLRVILLLAVLSPVLLLTACTFEVAERESTPAISEQDEVLVSLAELTQQDMDTILALPDKAAEFAAAATTVHFCSSPDPLNVDAGNGSVTYINNDIDPPGRSTGDNVETIYANCTHSVLLTGEVVIDGSIRYVVNDLHGAPAQTDVWNIDTTATANLTVSTPLASRTTTSNFNLQYGSTDGVVVTRAIKGDASYVQSIAGMQSEISRVYDAVYTEDKASQTYESRFDVTRENAGIGSKRYATTPALSGPVGQPPESGAMTVTEAIAGVTSIVTITALGTGNVQVDTDSNGDGVIDQTEQTTWSDIGRLWQVI